MKRRTQKYQTLVLETLAWEKTARLAGFVAVAAGFMATAIMTASLF